MFPWLKPDRQPRAEPHSLPRRSFKLTQQFTRDDREAPVIQADQLGKHLGAQPASLAGSDRSGRGGGVSCEVDAPPGLMAKVDEDRIRQAVDNLIDNALRFAPRGTQILVAGRQSRTLMIIEVAGAGTGFPAEFLPHAFERFRRPDPGLARRDGGAGLGLAIAAAAHGERVSARNDAAGGAAVRIELPVAPHEDADL